MCGRPSVLLPFGGKRIGHALSHADPYSQITGDILGQLRSWRLRSRGVKSFGGGTLSTSGLLLIPLAASPLVKANKTTSYVGYGHT